MVAEDIVLYATKEFMAGNKFWIGLERCGVLRLFGYFWVWVLHVWMKNSLILLIKGKLK